LCLQPVPEILLPWDPNGSFYGLEFECPPKAHILKAWSHLLLLVDNRNFKGGRVFSHKGYVLRGDSEVPGSSCSSLSLPGYEVSGFALPYAPAMIPHQDPKSKVAN
jgi:hypothetical protein